LRILLAIMVLAVCGKLAFDLLVMPSELYTLGDAGGGALIRVALILLAWATLTVQATAETVVAGLSRDAISITTNFEGSEILIFGAVSRTAPPPDGLGASCHRDGRRPATAGDREAQGAALRHLGQHRRDRGRRRADLLRRRHHRPDRHRPERDRGSAPSRLDPARDPRRGYRGGATRNASSKR
jgi:hypothetical protein